MKGNFKDLYMLICRFKEKGGKVIRKQLKNIDEVGNNICKANKLNNFLRIY